ncbi:MAG TPA: hypothetical protein P5238_11020 [Smithellaceae bacterium]|nr:hypothetical protein [Smithellaceae bacterium]HRS84003.1 hypothetical protein [Smithellaceae bacterium]
MKKRSNKCLWVGGCTAVLLMVFCLTLAFAGGPPLKENACGVCHKDYEKILPAKHPDVGKASGCLTCHKPDPLKEEPSKFSASIHQAHQGGKIKLDCSACHAL